MAVITMVQHFMVGAVAALIVWLLFFRKSGK